MKRTKKICPVCSREISLSNFDRHVKGCNGTIYMPTYALNHDGLVCQFCGKKCKNRNSLCNHERLCSLNPNKQINPASGRCGEKNPNYGKHSWNYLQTALTNDSVAKGVETYKKNKSLGLHKPNTYRHSPEKRAKLSEIMSNIYANKEPDTLITGRSKKGWYKGFYCQSSWELAFVIYCLEHSINFDRNKKGFKYIFNGTEHTYYPDFIYLDTNEYVEIKGYEDEKVIAKCEQFPEKLLLYKYNEMKPILEYVENKYGKDFIKLYE